MRISFAIELVLAVAVGSGMARQYYQSFDSLLTSIQKNNNYSWIVYVEEQFLAGFLATCGIALWIEGLRGRRLFRDWGVGRWTISISGLFVLLMPVWFGFQAFGGYCVMGVARWRAVIAVFSTQTLNWVSSPDLLWWDFLTHLTPSLVAFWLTALVALRPANRAPDAREWLGRGLIGVLLVSGIARWMIS